MPLRYRPRRTSSSTDALTELAGSTSRCRSLRVSFSGLQEFLYLFAAVSRSLHEPDDYARLAREFVEDALAQNVIYGELFVSPSVWTFFHPELDVRAAIEAIVSELRAARPRATFALLADLTRNFGAESAMANGTQRWRQ